MATDLNIDEAENVSPIQKLHSLVDGCEQVKK
jgi:hypothetical protein